jgi:dynein heavy chain
MIENVREQIRHPFKINEVTKKFPFKHEESMNSVLVQELARYNGLIEVIHASLETLELTLEGKLV